MTDDTLLLALAVHRAFGLRCAEKERLFHYAENSGTLERMSLDDVSIAVGRPLRFSFWTPAVAVRDAERDALLCERLGISVVPQWSTDYPPTLRESWDPPFVVFLRGILPAGENPSVAVVGTRHPDNAGLTAASEFAADCAACGIPVVSGLAGGIDAAAHRGTIAGGGQTVAVLGCGIDTVYPAANRRLAERLLSASGGLISEYPPGTPPLRHHFPIRNRIIAALSRWVVIVQAPERSGALITAEYALDGGRELLVHTAGCRAGAASAGSRALAEDGACAVSAAGELLGTDRRIYPGLARSTGSVEGADSGEISTLLARRLNRELDLFEPEPTYG